MQQRAIDRKRRTCGEDVESVGKERDGAEKQPEDSESESKKRQQRCRRENVLDGG